MEFLGNLLDRRFVSLRRHLAVNLELLKRNCLEMGITACSKSTFHLYDFSGLEVRIFNRKKRQLTYLLLSLSIYLLIMAAFHTWNNDHLCRLCKFHHFRRFLQDLLITHFVILTGRDAITC